MPYNYEDTFTPGANPTLERRYGNGYETNLTGERALANAPNSPWAAQNPLRAEELAYRVNDTRESMPYTLGAGVRRFAENPEPTIAGRILNYSPLAGGALGTGVGLLSGILGGWLKNKLLGGEGSATNWGVGGALAGGALGAMSSYMRQPDNLQKQAAMYNDPRNFILEKLQGANDISMSEKAKLASAVYGLDQNTARRLADAVRAAVGFGVGALIAKFIFGATGSGTLFGGLAGILGSAVLHNMTTPTRAPLLLGSQPVTYY